MHMNAKRPVLVPEHFVAELDTLSKAALMDLAYDLAAVASGDGDNEAAVMAKLREHRAVVEQHRKSAAKASRERFQHESARKLARKLPLAASTAQGKVVRVIVDDGLQEAGVHDFHVARMARSYAEKLCAKFGYSFAIDRDGDYFVSDVQDNGK